MPRYFPLHVPGRYAYDAWAKQQLEPQPAWDELDHAQQQDWCEIARAVLDWFQAQLLD